MADQKQAESFKVVDRRLFTAEGELRQDAVEQERREAESAAASTEAAKAIRGAAPREGRPPGGTSTATAPERGEHEAASPAADAPRPSRSFQLLIEFLARNAAALLGGFPDPRTGQAFLDLEGAHEIIDMLDTLREKTRGNLAPEDDRLLIDVLGSLKLSFLELSKAASQSLREKATSKS